MNKKGAEEQLYIYIFYLVIIVVFFGTFYYTIKLTGEDKLYNQKLLAVNLALLKDAVNSVPSNAEVTYNFEGVHTIKFAADNCKMSVLDEAPFNPEGIAPSYHCLSDVNNQDFSLEKVNSIIFKK